MRKKFLGIMALAGLTTLAADIGRVKAINDQRSQNFTDELVLQEPPMGLPEAYLHDLRSRVSPIDAETEMIYKKRDALEKKIQKINAGNEYLGVLLDVVQTRNNNTHPLGEAIRAIGRIGTREAKADLYSIIVEKSGDSVFAVPEGVATEELHRLDPKMAVNAIINGRGWSNSQIDILVESGDERSLRYLISKVISKGDAHDLYKFLAKNSGRGYVWKYAGSVTEIFDRNLRGGYHESHEYLCDRRKFETYGVMISRINPNYANRHLIPKLIGSCSDRFDPTTMDAVVKMID